MSGIGCVDKTEEHYDRWRKCWEAYLCGERWDPNGAYAGTIIESLERIADAGMNPVRNHDTSQAVANTPYYGLRALAMAYRIRGTKYYADPAVGQFIIEELERLYETEYNEHSVTTFGENWWLVEVGNPLRLLDILTLMYEELPDREARIARYTDVILHYRDSYLVSSHGKPETGANLVWKCHILLLTGILRREQKWVDWANGQLPSVLRYSKPFQASGMGTVYDDGFYPDGSFIQHYMFAYNGGYGKHLINILSGLLYAFRNEDCLALGREEKQFLYQMVQDAYEPLVYNGRFMDVARGREASRYFYEDVICGRHVMRALCCLAETMPQPEKSRTQSMLKEWLAHSGGAEALCRDESPYAEYFVNGSLVEAIGGLEKSGVPARGTLAGHYHFGVMGKPVHLTEHFGMALSLYSPATACYERLGAEGTKFWHMSDGVTYLYTADADQYNGNYYATADMQRLPGITVDRSPERYKQPYYNWYLPEARNVYAFAGGARLGCHGIAGMQYRGQGRGMERSLEVRKSWFLFDREVICVGSGITSPSGDAIETIVDNKKLLVDASNMITWNSEETEECAGLLGKETVKYVETVHLTGNCGKDSDVGYYFPFGNEIHLLCERREGTWNSVELNPENMCENNFAAIWIDHGTCPRNAGYVYVILPCISPDELRQYAGRPEIEILENSTHAHAAEHQALGITGVNFWEETQYTCAGITCSSQASVMLRRGEGLAEIAVADPAKSGRILDLSFDFTVKAIGSSEKGIEVSGMEPLCIKVNTAGLHGESLKLVVEI